MLMISFAICAVLLIATNSAIPAPSGHVLSAVIHNKQNIPIRCTITWQQFDNVIPEKDVLTIASKEAKTVTEKIVDMGSWTAFAFIKEIQCGSSLLVHPFQGVPSLEKLWNFDVESNGILSVGPTIVEPKEQ